MRSIKNQVSKYREENIKLPNEIEKKKRNLVLQKKCEKQKKKSGNEHAKIHYKICNKNKLKRKVRNMKKKQKKRKH